MVEGRHKIWGKSGNPKQTFIFFWPDLLNDLNFAVICLPLAPHFIQNRCGYPVFQALIHLQFNKFL